MCDVTATFVDMALSGQVMLDEIEDYVGRWHDGVGSGALHEFLGMTLEEYELWATAPDTLPLIVASRKQNRPLHAVANDNLHERRLAARAGALDITRLERWLENRRP